MTHDQITSPEDRIRCPVEHASLSARVCATRHVAREYRGHRHGHDVAAAARFPSCASCALGGIAQRRLGIPGEPGRQPVHRALPVIHEPVRVVAPPRRRAQPGPVDDIPAMNLRIVAHPHDVHATGRYPWVVS